MIAYRCTFAYFCSVLHVFALVTRILSMNDIALPRRSNRAFLSWQFAQNFNAILLQKQKQNTFTSQDGNKRKPAPSKDNFLPVSTQLLYLNLTWCFRKIACLSKPKSYMNTNIWMKIHVWNYISFLVCLGERHCSFSGIHINMVSRSSWKQTSHSFSKESKWKSEKMRCTFFWKIMW